MDGTNQTPFPSRTLLRRGSAGYRCAARAGPRCRPSDEHRRRSVPTRLYRRTAPGSTQEQPVTAGLRIAGLTASGEGEPRLFFSPNNDAVKLAKASRAALHRINVTHS